MLGSGDSTMNKSNLSYAFLQTSFRSETKAKKKKKKCTQKKWIVNCDVQETKKKIRKDVQQEEGGARQI